MTDSPRSESVAALDRLGLVLLGGLLAIIGGVLAQVYQARYTREQFAIQVRLKEQDDATSALKEISALADAPTSRALSLLDAVLANRPDSALRRLKARFDEAAEAWNLGY